MRSPWRAAQRPCALAIGGLDPGGGAGVLADARAFARAGAFGAAVVSVWTVQSTSGLESVTPVATREITRALACVLQHQRVRAIKTGALGGAGTLRAVLRVLANHPSIPLVVDPVIRPTRGKHGARLLEARAVDVLRRELLPRATLVTPNADEAHALTGVLVRSHESALEAAHAIVAMGARAVLLKGGHVPGARVSDLLVTRTHEQTWSRARIALAPTHGGGCTLAALIAGRLALSENRITTQTLVEAITWSRQIHARALKTAQDVGGRMRILIP